IAQYTICTEKETASELLIAKIHETTIKIIINNQATSGLLQHSLSTPETKAKLHFQTHKPARLANDEIYLQITGLDALWSTTQPSCTQFSLSLETSQHKEQHDIIVPYFSRRVAYYAVEYISYKLLAFMQTHHPAS